MNRIICAFFFLCTINIFGQSLSDTISVAKWPTKFIYHGKNLKTKEFNKIVPINDNAYRQVKKANSYQFLSLIFAAAGGGLIGYPIGSAMAGGYPNWGIAGIGAGCLAVMVPLNILSVKHAKKAVGFYNQELREKKTSSINFNVDFRLNGLALQLRF